MGDEVGVRVGVGDDVGVRVGVAVALDVGVIVGVGVGVPCGGVPPAIAQATFEVAMTGCWLKSACLPSNWTR